MEVTSPSGSATLGIPEGAIPTGVDPGSIKILEPEVPDQFADTALIAAFDLEPDGTTFLKPLTVTMALDSQAGGLPALALISGESAELLPTTVEIDAETGATVVSAPIAHFSTLVAYASNIKGEIANSGDHPVGAQFDVTVTISRVEETGYVAADESFGSSSQQLLSKVMNALAHAETFGPVTVNTGTFFAPSNISPSKVEPAPDRPSTIENDAFSFTQRFVCRDPGMGMGTISYVGHTDQAVTGRSVFLSPISAVQRINFIVDTRRFRCLAATPTGTRTPTPKPTPTPTTTPLPDFEDLLDQLNGIYDVTRAFTDNNCGYETHTGAGPLSTGADGVANHFTFDIVNDAPLLSHMEYTGVINPDMTFTMQEVDPDFYDARVVGTISGQTLEFEETIQMFRDDSPCKGETFIVSSVATKQ